MYPACSTIPHNLGNPSLQFSAIDLSRFELASLVEGDNTALLFSICEDDAGLLTTPPDKMGAMRPAVSRNDKVDLFRNRDGIREDHLCSIRGHIADDAINRETWMAELDRAAQKRSSALDLTTFDHLAISQGVTVVDPNTAVSNWFAKAWPPRGLPVVKVNLRALSGDFAEASA